MANKTINTRSAFKTWVIVYAIILVAGIVATCIFGVKLDINFSGGTRISYSYTGTIKQADFEDAVDEVIKADHTVSQNESIAGDTKAYVITLVGKDALEAKTQEALTEALQEEFSNNSIELYDSNSVSPTVAGGFLLKSIAAVLLTAILVVVYVGFRFRKIGGVSAALTAFCALILDLLVSFIACVIFSLQIDSNYIAVVLTILGYSLNDTIVIYDRVRENRKLYPQMSLNDNMDMSISGVITRNIVTTVTTVMAVLTIVVVSEIYGLTSLRTFAIPMAFGLVSGCFSSLFISGPIWVYWREFRERKTAEKAQKKA